MSEISITRHKLTIIFSIILITLFLFVWIWFLTFKYESSQMETSELFSNLVSNSKKSQSWIIEYITANKDKIVNYPFEEAEKLDIGNIINSIENDINYIIWNLDSVKIIQNIPIHTKNEFQIFKHDFIILSDKQEVLLTNISNYKYINYKTPISSYEDAVYYENNSNKAVWNIRIANYNVIIFINTKYPLYLYQRDIIWYSIAIMFLWLFIYFIVNLLVKKSLKPIEENIDSMNYFIHNAWHELKTPLASISSSIWLLKETKNYDEELVIESIEEINRANRLIETLRDLTKIQTTTNKEKFSVLERIEHITEIYKSELKNKQIKLEINSNYELIINSNKYYFDILVSNLVANAIKYNNQLWFIKINILNSWLSIEDSWIWIAKKELKKIFERFYRVKKHRDSEWFWLWLSIVDKIVKINNWKLKVKSEEWKWTVFSLLLY